MRFVISVAKSRETPGTKELNTQGDCGGDVPKRVAAQYTPAMETIINAGDDEEKLRALYQLVHWSFFTAVNSI